MAKLKQLDLFFDMEPEVPSTTNEKSAVVPPNTSEKDPIIQETPTQHSIAIEEDSSTQKTLLPPIEKVYDITEQITNNSINAQEAITSFTPIPNSAKTRSKRGRKSIQELEASAHQIEIPEDEVLFSKLYYSMGEVSNMFKVNHSLLRFWESEFDILKPRKNRKGDRHFRPEDIKNLITIHHLLRVKKLTIPGAIEYLKNQKKVEDKFSLIQQLQKLKNFLLEIKANIETQNA
jgi:DNA-binding transcriptional MerR regulator